MAQLSSAARTGVLAGLTAFGLGAVYYLNAVTRAKAKAKADSKKPLPKLGGTVGLASAPADAKMAAAAAAALTPAGGGPTMEARFSAAAETWDLADRHKLLAEKGVALLRERCKLDPNSTTVLEFGCGTAGVSLGVAPYVKRVVALDSAPGMISVVTRKAAEQKLTCKVVPLLRRVDSIADWPSKADNKEGVPLKFDVIYTAMAFHHVPDPHACLALFRDLLKPGGTVMIVDLVKTSFSTEYHPLGTHGDVYAHGFALTDINAWYKRAGLTQDVRVAAEFTVHKADYDHPIFVASASKCH